jgi:hypothetical protein
MAHVALTVRGRYLHVVEEDGHAVVRADSPTIEPGSLLTRVRLGHDRIALRTIDGRFLAVRPEGQLSFALTVVPELTADAAFEEVLWPNGQVSLRSSQLTYVTGHRDGSTAANRTLTGAGERLAFVSVPATMVPAQVRRRVIEPTKVLPSVR